MRRIWKDIFAAFLIGMVLPAAALNMAVTLQRQLMPVQQIHVTIPEATEEKQTSLPVKLRSADGLAAQADMDEYLTCVVLAEMPAVFDTEALKAQAVAARTYARKAWVTGGKHGDGSVCTQSGCCQAYITPEAYMEKGGTADGLAKVRDAVLATSGECLTYEGELIEATYFSCSGGSTEDALAVWGADYPYLQAVDSPGEEGADWFTDTVVLTTEALEDALDITLSDDPEQWFGEVVHTRGGGVQTMVVGGKRFAGTQLRSLLGLRSTAFTVVPAGSSITITTYGYGHRVGMSQYGAEAMAVNGSSYRQILARYYPGTELVQFYNDEAIG